jgi:hypothetical protein
MLCTESVVTVEGLKRTTLELAITGVDVAPWMNVSAAEAARRRSLILAIPLIVGVRRQEKVVDAEDGFVAFSSDHGTLNALIYGTHIRPLQIGEASTHASICPRRRFAAEMFAANVIRMLRRHSGRGGV